MSTATTYLTEFVAGLHPLVQFLAVFAIGLIPYLESHVGAFVGTVTGVPVVVATLAAIAGNLIALVVAVRAGGAVARRVAQRRTPARRTQKVLAKVDKFGVPLASLLGPFVLATALSTFIMIGAGLHRRTVIIWQVVAVTAWGVAFAVLGLGAQGVLS